ncbi:MAG: hypothetical protein LBT54_06380 [Bifidobacteriaceae bacterium]|jgi:hypothetical protein|nr:hypothetical protein [Bifidobacteriaceae bacterium]
MPVLKQAGKLAACAVAGAVAAGFGTLHHIAVLALGPVDPIPVGLVLGSLLVLAVSLFARAWGRLGGLAAATAGIFGLTQAMALTGPGGDVLIASRPLGYAWLVLAVLLPVGVAFAPRRWFRDGAAAAPAPEAPPRLESPEQSCEGPA